MGDVRDMDFTDDSTWVPIRSADNLYGEPAELPPPLVVPAPSVLNTHELPWATFERLILRIAREVDDARDPRLYGNPGQAQHGIDIVGFFAEAPPTVYQAKDVGTFSSPDLRKAIEKYALGRRPFGATRLVVAVGCGVRETAALETLAALRAEHRDLQIEVWDKEEISRLLENRFDLVSRFFGTDTARAFCNRPPDTMVWPPSNGVEADALIRGPLLHLGLTPRLAEATRIEAGNPSEAAGMYGEVALALEASPYVSHAMLLRSRQLSALQKTAAHEERAILALDAAWKFVSSGDSHRAATTLMLDGLTISSSTARSIKTAEWIVARRRDFGVQLESVWAVFDEQLPADPHFLDALVFLVEETVSSRQDALIVSRRIAITDAVDRCADENNLRDEARIRMCLADATGDWNELIRDGRRRYAPALFSWITARHARYLTRRGNSELADEKWLDSIERACQEGNMGDAANWLYARRANRTFYGLPGEDEHHLAQVVRSAGSGSVFPELFRYRERALSRLGDEKWADALDACNYYRWHSTISASLADELDSHDRLGDLYRLTGFSGFAVRHYVCGYQSDKLKQLASEIPDEVTELDQDLYSGPEWEKVACLKFVGVAGDLLADTNARWWLERALAILYSEERAQTLLTPNPRSAAFAVAATLAPLLTADEASQYLGISKPLIARPAGKYRFTDQDVVTTILSIAQQFPELGERALDQAIDSITADSGMAQRVRQASALLEGNAELVNKRLRGHVGKSLAAALTLTQLGMRSQALRSVARSVVAKHLAEDRTSPSGSVSYRDFSSSAFLCTILPSPERTSFSSQMLRIAYDRTQSAVTRQQALSAISTIAVGLAKGVRRKLFSEIMRSFVSGRENGSELDQFTGEAHPFSRIRLELGQSSLVGAALVCASQLACTAGQFQALQARAVELLRECDRDFEHQLALALSHVPSDLFELDIQLLASSTSESMRALAAVHCLALGVDRMTVLALANDRSRLVRMTLVSNMPDGSVLDHEVVSVLLNDPRRSIRMRALRLVGE
jgi:hypothetical protein